MATTDDKGPTIIGITMMFEAFAVVALVLRIWSQKILRRKFFAHDVLVLLGFTFATALAICLVISVVFGGLGKHALELIGEPWRLVLFGKLLIVIQVLWALGMTCIRISILNLYVHLFSAHKGFRIACYGVMVICVLWVIADLLVVFLLCQPLAYNWDKSILTGSCGNITAAYLAAHSSNFGIDSTIALLPIPTLWSLQLPARKKIGIIAMFALGALICSISIARIVMYQQALGYDQTDFTYAGSTLYIFTAMEPLISCSLSCLPLLRPAAEKVSSAGSLSWLRSRGSRYDGSKFTSNTSDLGHDSMEGLQSQTTASRGPKGQRQSQSNTRDGIRVNVNFDRYSYEMAHAV